MNIAVTEELISYFQKKDYDSITLENLMHRQC